MTTPSDPTGVRRLVDAVQEFVGECACDYSDDGPCWRCAGFASALAAVRVAELERVVEATRKLEEKIRLIHNDETYLNVWLCAEFHFGKYKGPKYSAELEEVEEALAALDERGTT